MRKLVKLIWKRELEKFLIKKNNSDRNIIFLSRQLQLKVFFKFFQCHSGHHLQTKVDVDSITAGVDSRSEENYMVQAGSACLRVAEAWP
jgi:hypothetical protein